MGTVLGLAVVTVIGLGAGFGLSKMFPPPPPSPTPDVAAAEKPPSSPAAPEAKDKDGKPIAPVEVKVSPAASLNPADLKDVVLAPFAPITTNIANPSNVWIRLEGSMALKPANGTKPADLVELASTKMVAYVRTLKLVDVQGPIGFLAMNSDLNEIVRSATDGQARAVLITGFIVE